VIKLAFAKVKKGHVISQTPGHGRHLLNGAKINLRVSKGTRL
jgi:beta-lactam-binding protein with PASTA domain